MFVPIRVGDFTLNKRAKFSVQINNEEIQYCINAQHLSMLLQSLGFKISPCDVYNYGCEERRTKSLMHRFPDHVRINKLTEDARRTKRRLEKEG